ncbi:hypothetical protein F7984_14605 [Pradoshia sp. D12]|uniref:hypothetical protein n=1 Tax=Bacillaceae TaxID=186817 RepID=UPI00112D7541|nr:MULTISPECIES: hypothetical protein [Bacillaceae]QFK72383.1 hypothetical protein F7984_14605 [Pradoshia sp. D12]TPF71123.1 hypothetical protein FHY44_11590 [Bacillus sp. D12]
MSPSKKMPLEIIMNNLSLLVLALGFIQVFYKWSVLGGDDVKKSMALPLIGVIVWGAFTFIEKSDENINLPIFLSEDKNVNIKYNRLLVNILKNIIVIGLIVVNWIDLNSLTLLQIIK